MLKGINLRRGMAWGVIIVGALLAFEIFNYSTTQFALADVLGSLKFAGIPWATILALAFCGIDFAGIARLFTPEQGRNEPAEVWYLFGAWLLAAAMNAALTWWGVSVAIVNHNSLAGGVVYDQYNPHQSCAGLCGCHGLAHPRADHRYLLDRRRTSFQPGRCALASSALPAHCSSRLVR